MKFLEPIWFLALWAVPIAAAALGLALVLRRRAVRRFVGESFVGLLAGGMGTARRLAKVVCVLVALALISLALARPGFNPTPRKVHRSGRDVAILLDVSRSMLAQDVKPSRLERAKYI